MSFRLLALLFFVTKFLQANEPLDNTFCVLSIAKSGTNLINKAISQITKKNGKYWIWHKQELPSLTHNEFLYGHFYVNKRLEKLDHRKMKFIIIIRDLRDVFVSSANYYQRAPYAYEKYLKKPESYPYYFDLWQKSSTSERIEIMLDSSIGKSNPVVGIRNAVKWLKEKQSCNDILIIRFYDLIGPNGGGNSEAQIESLNKISKFLGVTLANSEIRAIANNLWGSSPTFYKGLVGRYKEYFTETATTHFWELLTNEMEYFTELSNKHKSF